MKTYAAVHHNPSQSFPKVWVMTEGGFAAWGTKKSINSKSTTNSAASKYNEKVGEGYTGLGTLDVKTDAAAREVAAFLANVAHAMSRGGPVGLPLTAFSNDTPAETSDKMITLARGMMSSLIKGKQLSADKVPLPDGRILSLTNGSIVGNGPQPVSVEPVSQATDKLLAQLVKKQVVVSATDTAW